MQRFDEYLELINMTYEEACKKMHAKYGEVRDDFFREASYERFLKGEIKNPTKGKYSATDQGLYCHHIDEDKYENLAQKSYIKRFKIPFKHQKKERLVYCDLIEHTILHALIAIETKGRYGLRGYNTYTKRTIVDWYILGNKPGLKWMQNCYKKAYLDKAEARKILSILDSKLEENLGRLRF